MMQLSLIPALWPVAPEPQQHDEHCIAFALLAPLAVVAAENDVSPKQLGEMVAAGILKPTRKARKPRRQPQNVADGQPV